MTTNDDSVVLLERQGTISRITLNRPEALNSINKAVRTALPLALATADADPDTRVIVLRGAGDRAFCSGADIKEFVAVPRPFAYREARTQSDWVRALDRVRKPVIAAVHGYCLGGGLEIALACDIRIATSDACFGLPEVGLGTLPGAGGTQRLSRIVGLGHALAVILSGERIDANEAYRIGLVSKLVAPGELENVVTALATTISSRAPLAVIAAKEAVRDGAELNLEAGLRLELDLLSLLLTTEDRPEAGAAFREKRKPVFKGR